MSKQRQIEKVIQGMPTSDGAGVNLTRIVGQPHLSELDPFLLLDEFRTSNSDDYMAGFPAHPHRGFETVTYMKEGNFRHKDSTGGEGFLKSGGVQWMTAGRGIIHSETPEQNEGLLWGYQLWLNLPRDLKMSEPGYQNIQPETIPKIEQDDKRITLIAGEYAGSKGPARSFYPVNYFDVELEPGAVFEHAVPETMSSFLYLYDGQVESGDNVTAGNIAVLGAGDSVRITAGEKGAGFLFLAAERIEEPIARHGPFVMNTQQEIMEAFHAYQNGTLTK